jgi:heme/copper-type cytochrome/quinol oxidase subunit 3
VTATTVTEQLALPSGDRDRPVHVLSLGALLLGIASSMVSAGIVAAYFEVRGVAKAWPPAGVRLDNYLGVTLFLTLVLAAVTVEWAPFAIKRGNRRHALWALGLTLGFGVSFLNLLWYLASQLGFGPADHAFGALMYAALIAVGVQLGLAVGFVLIALIRTAGHQVAAGQHEVVRAAAWYWHSAGVSWLVTFTAFYVLQHR